MILPILQMEKLGHREVTQLGDRAGIQTLPVWLSLSHLSPQQSNHFLHDRFLSQCFPYVVSLPFSEPVTTGNLYISYTFIEFLAYIPDAAPAAGNTKIQSPHSPGSSHHRSCKMNQVMER